MIRHRAFFLNTLIITIITTSVLLTTTAIAKSTLLTGCSALNFNSGASCFINGVEILPNIHIRESGILSNIESVEGCQAACQQFHDCQYFTFRVNKATNSKTCHLKPAASDASAPVMVSRQYDDNSKFGYTSGPKECGQKCTEGTEIRTGCGASSPSSCGLIGDSVFDAECASKPSTNCGKVGYSCCRDCEKEGSCCNTRINGWVLTDGIDFDKASQWTGVNSADQCHTLCVKTQGCTHWNFITSESMSFIGGACYLKTYDPVNRPEYEEATSYLTSIIGAVDCSQDYGIKDPSPSSTATPPDVTGNPIEGTCFESNIDILEGQLYKQWGPQNATVCQELCQKWPGCKFFVFTPEDTGCSLKYSDHGRSTIAEQQDFIVGPRDCPDAQPAPIVEGCVTPDMDIDSGTVQELPALHAAECGLKCLWHGEDQCQGWTYLNRICYIKPSNTPMVSKPGVASGVRGCSWPEYGRRRVLSIDDVLPSALIVDGCAQQDKDYFGGDLESIAGVESLEICRHLCLEREDCKVMSYSSTDHICKIKWGGELVDRIGSIAMPRLCQSCKGDQCSRSTTDFFSNGIQPVNGISHRSLGKPSEWIVKGDMINFSSPSTWQRLALLVLTDDIKEDCYVSDLISTSAEHNCWDQRANYLPLHAHVQIIGVTAGAQFKGWSSVQWEAQSQESSVEDGHFELFNQEITIEETNKPNSDHGVFIQPIADKPLPLSWPVDMTSPLNFQDGLYYARLRSLSTPIPISLRIMFCLTGSDYPVSEICTTPMVVPPFDA